MRYIQGSIGIASNGSITNFNEIRQELETGGAVFQSNSNAEIMAYVIATERCVTDTLEDAVLSSMRKLKGAYSTVICAPSRLIGFRDMHGFRPLCIGKLKTAGFSLPKAVLSTVSVVNLSVMLSRAKW